MNFVVHSLLRILSPHRRGVPPQQDPSQQDSTFVGTWSLQPAKPAYILGWFVQVRPTNSYSMMVLRRCAPPPPLLLRLTGGFSHHSCTLMLQTHEETRHPRSTATQRRSVDSISHEPPCLNHHPMVAQHRHRRRQGEHLHS